MVAVAVNILKLVEDYEKSCGERMLKLLLGQMQKGGQADDTVPLLLMSILGHCVKTCRDLTIEHLHRLVLRP